MNEATRLLEEASAVERVNPPVECARGHYNDPYPENGQCTECSIYLPANPAKFTPDTGKEARARGVGGDKSRDEIAHGVLEDEGVPWDDATEGMRQLALLFAKSKNTKTYELILQQIGVLKAKPKPGEEAVKVEYQVAITAATVDSLKDSLQDLADILRID